MDQKREVVLAVFVQLGLALFICAEALSLFHALSRTWVVLFWAGALIAIAARTRVPLDRPKFDLPVALCCVAIAAILTCTAIAAALSPPNSSDAMAYHMPRAIYWAEQASVRFFPTPYLNQIMLQPLAEYAMLHLYLLTGSDALTNFVQWTAALGSIVGVSAIAAQLGAAPRSQAVAALFCATVPSGVLAASGAKNDWVLALWIVCSVYFALKKRHGLLGIAIGLALLTKATAYLFLPALLLATMVFERRVLIALPIALAINTPHSIRNIGLSGSPLGFDSAQGDGAFRWRNETFGWKQTLSNALRHTGEQLAAHSDRWNRRVFDAVTSIHASFNIDPNDRATTWPGAHYAAPRNSNHETDAPNRWHLLALILIAATLRGRFAAYAAALACAFLAACFYLKWQPFMGRLFLPLFVAAAPLASLLRPRIAQAALCLLLLDGARLPALQNWVRPLEGPRSVFTVSRHDQYFADLTARNNQASYEQAADLIAASRCPAIGIDINVLQLEYPMMALIRERIPGARFLHTDTRNASSRYTPPIAAEPCAIVCLECKNGYPTFAKSSPAGTFTVFTH